MATVRTAVLVKPDGLQRGLIGEIIARFERKGLKLVGLKMVQMTDAMLSDWYVEHKDRSFFGDLKSFMGSMPIVAMQSQICEAEGITSVVDRETNSGCWMLR